MSIVSSRRMRRAVVACLVVSACFASPAVSGAKTSHASATPRAARAAAIDAGILASAAPRALHVGRPALLRVDDRAVLSFAPPIAAGARPGAVLYLHGAHGRPENGCPHFRAGASEVGWLVCPEGVVREPAGTWSWGDDLGKQQAIVHAALRGARAEGASSEPAVAVGFSQGSFVALDLIKTRRASFRALLLIGADVHPNVARLQAAGVQRVALAAGARDAAYASMKEEAARLSAEGMESRFFDLGAVGHTYAGEPEVLRGALAWAAAR